MKNDLGPQLKAGGSGFASRERVLRIASLAVVVLILLGVLLFRSRLMDMDFRQAAYGGVFLLAFLGSASILIPVPGVLVVYWGGSSLNLGMVAVVAGIAEGLGELSGYLVGFAGSGLVEKHRLYMRVRRWMQWRGGWVVFLMACIPNPMFDLVGMVAGGLHFPVWRFLAAAWAGKTLKNLLIASMGYFSVPLLLRWYEHLVG